MPHAVPYTPPARPLYLAPPLALPPAALLGLVGVGLYLSATRWVDHTLAVRLETYEWLTSMLDAETAARGYVASGQPAFLEPYNAALRRERQESATVRSLIVDNAE